MCRGHGNNTSRFLNLGSRQRWIVSFTSQPLCTHKKGLLPSLPAVWIPRAGLDAVANRYTRTGQSHNYMMARCLLQWIYLTSPQMAHACASLMLPQWSVWLVVLSWLHIGQTVYRYAPAIHKICGSIWYVQVRTVSFMLTTKFPLP
jgi:hypothetical protein